MIKINENKEVLKSTYKKTKTKASWLITFADLMALLLCFFILLFSFSNMDLEKYKKVVQSMQEAFSSDLKSKTGVNYKHLPININLPLQQSKTISDIKNNIVKQNAGKIVEQIVEEIKIGTLELEVSDEKILIRITDKESFGSGQATLKPTFLPSVNKIANILVQIPGQIRVEGFTDDIPINNDLFGSNWELSAYRAASVLNELLKNKKLDSKRFTISGNADNKPLIANDSPNNRAINRRVELIVFLEKDYEIDELFDENFLIIEKNIEGKDIEDEMAPNDYSAATEKEHHTFAPIYQDEFDDKKDDDLGIFTEEAFYNY